MPTDQPVAVLVVVAPGSPLLAPGRCGAKPPRVGIRWPPRPLGETGSVSLPPVFTETWSPGSGQVAALPLWWPSEAHPEGELVPEGWDRLARLRWGPYGVGYLGPLHRVETLNAVITGARDAEAGGAGRVVLLHRGPDGALVEVTP